MSDSDIHKNTKGSSSPDLDHSCESSRRKRRTMSDATGFGSDKPALSRYHPAMSLAEDFETFGPLIFPLYRAALLKKRVLIMTAAPVRPACNLIYNLSVLSNIPASMADVVNISRPLHPIRPLFNVGVHDIASLSQTGGTSNPRYSWIACSTDDILGTKTSLYDVIVELPPPKSSSTGTKQWPKIRTSDGQALKATQRDLRRYYTLKRELYKSQRLSRAYHDDDDEAQAVDDESETVPLTRTNVSEEDEYLQLDGESALVEPSSWASIVYSSFLWWASAGERDALLEDEASQDARLLDDLPLPYENTGSRPSSKSGGKRPSTDSELDGRGEELQAIALLLIAYVQRLTALTMETLAEIVEAADAEEEIPIQSEDLRRMGLDDWSQSDGSFVKEMAELYFERGVNVQKQDVELCGIKIC